MYVNYLRKKDIFGGKEALSEKIYFWQKIRFCVNEIVFPMAGIIF